MACGPSRAHPRREPALAAWRRPGGMQLSPPELRQRKPRRSPRAKPPAAAVLSTRLPEARPLLGGDWHHRRRPSGPAHRARDPARPPASSRSAAQEPGRGPAVRLLTSSASLRPAAPGRVRTARAHRSRWNYPSARAAAIRAPRFVAPLAAPRCPRRRRQDRPCGAIATGAPHSARWRRTATSRSPGDRAPIDAAARIVSCAPRELRPQCEGSEAQRNPKSPSR